MAKTMLAALALCAAASAHAAVGDYAMFFPSRDWGNLASDGDLGNSGLFPHHYAYRQGWGGVLPRRLERRGDPGLDGQSPARGL